MATTELERLQVVIEGNHKLLQQSLEVVTKQLGAFEKSVNEKLGGLTRKTKDYERKTSQSFSDIGRAIQAAGAAYLSYVAAIRPLTRLTVTAAQTSDGLNELNRTSADSVSAFNTWNTTLSNGAKKAELFGTSLNSTYKTFGQFVKLTGNTEAAKAVSDSFILLQASTGRSADDLTERLRSAYTGSIEAIENVLLGLTRSYYDAAAAAEYGAKSFDSLTDAQQKAIVTAAIVTQTYEKTGGKLTAAQAQVLQFNTAMEEMKLQSGFAMQGLLLAVLPALQIISRAFLAVIPYIKAFVDVLVGFFGISTKQRGIKLLDGSVQDSLRKTIDLARNSKKASDHFGSAATNAKQLKNSLSGLDKLNILPQQNQSMAVGGNVSSSDALSGIGGTDTKWIEDIGKQTEQLSGYFDKIQKKVDEIKAKYSGLLKVMAGITIAVATVVGVASVVTAIVTVVGAVQGAFAAISTVTSATAQWITGLRMVGIIVNFLIRAGGIMAAAWEAIVGVVVGIAAVLAIPVEVVVAIIAVIIAAIVLLVVYWDEVVAGLAAAWDFIVGVVKAAWGVIVKFTASVVKVIIGFFQPVINFFKEWGRTIFVVLTLPFQLLASFIYQNWNAIVSFMKGLWRSIANVASVVWNSIIATVTKVMNAITQILVTFKNFTVGVWTSFQNTASIAFANIKTFITPFVNKVVQFFQPMVTFLNGLWNKAVTSFTSFKTTVMNDIPRFIAKVKSVFGPLIKFLGTLFTGVGSGLKMSVNVIIEGLNHAIKGINKSLAYVNKLPGVDAKTIPTIPKLAKGGIVDSAQLFIAGEAGKEAIMPLENNTGWINQLAAKINTMNGGGSSGFNGTIVVNMGGYEVGRITAQQINAMSRQSGQPVLNI